ncbi:ABC transporter permease [Paenibacillus eucommiae]|uniref:Ribose/xylose/arabinose/galactoside ABC-type transport system permease subunit n=1 Tax=Paenibacillus eucommiae TaxID=1355755 RepID=A0ABS4J8E4_9BACL|nr:ribose ABC transporter permease [Paenibacillus eucommiae]MBP1996088.1 ribose/xylose/arabinose/galactoside ABC-type transport system permease subunit [Paenibacillus eucommiae]
MAGHANSISKMNGSNRNILKKYGLLIALLSLCIIFSLTSPVFVTEQNILNILNQVSINAILAIGVTFVIIIGGIDLGLGSYVALTGCLAALLAQSSDGTLLPILVGVGAGLVIGYINGLIITKGKLAAFIVTLGMMTIARGGALVISEGRPISNLSPAFNHIAGGTILGIQIPILIVLAILIISFFVLKKTVFGRYVYAVGGNAEAARASGINVNKIKMYVYILCGGLAGVAGIIQASRITTGQPSIGVGYELDAIAAAVIGGTSLSGGSGKIMGTIIGALIIGVINNGLDLLNVPSYFQQIIKGMIIIGALLLDRKSEN